MATNEQQIINGQSQSTNQAAQLQIDLEEYIEALQAISLLSIDTDEPALGYAQNDTIETTFTTEVTANFQSGLAYPIFDDILADAKTDGYDSAFLNYLEEKLTSKPTQAWVDTIKSVKQDYSASTTVSAQNFVVALIPLLGNGNTYSSAMTSQVDDKASTEATEEGLIWGAIANDLVLTYQQKAINSGVDIEEIRASIIADMVVVHSDYNAAVLQQARVDFSALSERVTQIQTQIKLQIDSTKAKNDQQFNFARLKNREFILETDKDLATTKDDVRRTQMDYSLQFARGKALIEYIGSSIAQAELSGSYHGNYTSSSSGE